MAQERVHIGDLPASPLEASAHFQSAHMPALRQTLSDARVGRRSVVIVLPPASYEHEGWRRALVRDLARAYAPVRVNMLSGNDAQAISQAAAYLDAAPGVTGQLFDLIGQEAGNRA